MKRGRKTALSFAVLASFAVAVSCREPTQVTVRVSTGAKCSELSGVEIVVGPDQQETQHRFEKQFSTALTRDCDPSGLIGTLVVAPGGHDATIVVAAGVTLGGAPAPEPTSCADPEIAKSCIIARRRFSFLEHTSLTLPVVLDPVCIGKTCDPGSTCFKGACVDAAVTCNGSDCGLVQEHPGEGDAGANEASSSDGAYDADLDGMSFEDVTPRDAATKLDTGMDTGVLVPPCGGISMSQECKPSSLFGTATIGACGDKGDTSRSCCSCTCMGTGTVASCDLFTSMTMASCYPTCP